MPAYTFGCPAIHLWRFYTYFNHKIGSLITKDVTKTKTFFIFMQHLFQTYLIFFNRHKIHFITSLCCIPRTALMASDGPHAAKIPKFPLQSTQNSGITDRSHHFLHSFISYILRLQIERYVVLNVDISILFAVSLCE
jgi:hypothetical protein